MAAYKPSRNQAKNLLYSKKKEKRHLSFLKEDLFEAIRSLNYFAKASQERAEEIKSILTSTKVSDKEIAILKQERGSHVYYQKSMMQLKELVIDRMVFDGYVFFESFTKQENPKRNQRYLLANFISKNGDFEVKRPAKPDDLILAIAPFKVETKLLNPYTMDVPPEKYSSFKEVMEYLVGYLDIPMRYINGHLYKGYNAFNTEKMKDDDGNDTPSFTSIEVALSELRERKQKNFVARERLEEITQNKTVENKSKGFNFIIRQRRNDERSERRQKNEERRQKGRFNI